MLPAYQCEHAHAEGRKERAKTQAGNARPAASLVLGKLPFSCISPYLSSGAKKQLGSPEAEESKTPKKALECQCPSKAKHRQGTTCRDFSQDLSRRLLECLWNANTPAKLNIGSGLNARDFSQDLSKHDEERMRLCPRHTSMANLCGASQQPSINCELSLVQSQEKRI